MSDFEKIDSLASQLCKESHSCEGYLTDKEARFLTVLSACTPGNGVTLEIGSFKGKSTIILSKAEQEIRGEVNIVAMDPLTSPSETDPDNSSRDDFYGNLDRAGVKDVVEFYEQRSQELSDDWDRPIRLLWIDGDHTNEGVTSDIVNYVDYLEVGGVIAFHDVMHFEGVSRAFAELILRSDKFGPAGIVGSIGWAQLRKPDSPDPYKSMRVKLALGLERHALSARKGDSGIRKIITKLHRSRVPHGDIGSRRFQELLES
jgi:predicted O-methyltransferase YrrM